MALVLLPENYILPIGGLFSKKILKMGSIPLKGTQLPAPFVLYVTDFILPNYGNKNFKQTANGLAQLKISMLYERPLSILLESFVNNVDILATKTYSES